MLEFYNKTAKQERGLPNYTKQHNACDAWFVTHLHVLPVSCYLLHLSTICLELGHIYIFIMHISPAGRFSFIPVLQKSNTREVEN